MTLRELKIEFQNTLKDVYPSEEVQSFFSILSEEYLGLTRIDIVLKADTLVSEEKTNRFLDAIEQLKKHRPIQYIIGNTEFYGLPFKVSEHVLIPRPETEELVDWIVNDIQKQDQIKILDIGTGSGCIGISLAHNLKKASISVLDVSEEAISVARENATQNNVSVKFLQEDILECQQLPEKYDVIVSNPPYVRISEKTEMKNNVLKHEPDLALFVENNDPLLFYEKIASLAQEYLKVGGSLYFEINEYLGNDMNQLLELKGFKGVILKKDMFGKERMIKCRKDG
ncbi:MAG: peptide chain release factor N(5)-glutamine methyltransferase [Flavobacteriaceae bacterium]|nr:peptide chain release factor N(5)-glutamine methyltransferase [Flavobacteriaceae bacterium]